MGGHTDSPPPEREQLIEVFRRHQALRKGLEKAVADPATEWVDANIVRLLLDRAGRPMADYAPCGRCGHVGPIGQVCVRCNPIKSMRAEDVVIIDDPTP